MVDGFLNCDGMVIEAKYVNNPNKPCYRSLDELRANHRSGKKDFLYDKDRRELAKYNAALNDPRNKELRGIETVTNNADIRGLLARHDGRLRPQGLRPIRTLTNRSGIRRGSERVDASELAGLRTMYVFGPAEGSTWGLTYEGIEAKLRERKTGTFLRGDEGD